MSWMLQRVQRKLAGWYDSFDRAVQNPVTQPWRHFGLNGGGDINSLQELHIQSYGDPALAGGVSYEFEAFTPHYGFEAEIWFPATGITGQSFWIYIGENWSKAGSLPNMNQVTAIGAVHVAAGDSVQIYQIPNLGATGSSIASGTPPVAFNGNYFTLKFLVEDDRWVRCYFNDVFMCQAALSPSYRTDQSLRGLNLNALRTDGWVRWVKWFDRDPSVPTGLVWNSVFVETFDRANGAAGNGWTTDGTSVGITANSWGMNTGSPSDGSRGLTRDTGITNGRMRVEATVGGQHGISNTQDSSIILCSNAGRTQGLAANIFGNKAFLARWSGSLTSPTFTDLSARTNDITLANGDVLAANLYDGVMWLENATTGERYVYADNVHAVVPASNSWAGLRVERAVFVNSNSWNAVTIKAA